MNAISTRKKPSLSVVSQPGTFNAIQKVCAILRVLAQHAPLRLTEIAEATSLNKATTLRILVSLSEEGFVSRLAGAKTYELGQEARVMAVSARRTVDIAELAQPSLLRLSERSADTALLSVRSGVEALYLARSVGSHPLQPNYLQIGSRRPLGVGGIRQLRRAAHRHAHERQRRRRARAHRPADRDLLRCRRLPFADTGVGRHLRDLLDCQPGCPGH